MSYRARVDGKTVVLVLDVGVANSDASATTDIESVGIVSQGVAIRVSRISVGVVDGNSIQSEAFGSVNGEHLDG